MQIVEIFRITAQKAVRPNNKQLPRNCRATIIFDVYKFCVGFKMFQSTIMRKKIDGDEHWALSIPKQNGFSYLSAICMIREMLMMNGRLGFFRVGFSLLFVRLAFGFICFHWHFGSVVWFWF